MVTVFAAAIASSIPAYADGAPSSALPASNDVVTLTQCVAQALKTGPDILVSRAAVAKATTAYTQAAAANGFSLSGTASLSHTNTETNITEDVSTTTEPTDSLGAGLSLSGPLSTSLTLSANHGVTEETVPDSFTSISAALTTTVWDGYAGGQELATVRKQALTLQSTKATENAAQRTVLYNVKKAYYTMLAEQGQRDLARETLAKRQEELAKAQTLYGADNATLIDLRTAQVNAREAELDLRLAEGTLDTDRETLSVLVGWPLHQSYTVAETQEPALSTADTDVLVRQALERRADLKALQLSLKSAEIDIALSRADMSPTISANGGVNVKYHWSQPTSSLQWSASMNIAMPILDAGSGAAAVSQAEMTRQSCSLQLDQLTATIATDVKSAVDTLRDKQARVELAALSVELARNEYELARMQYEAGTGTHLDMLTESVALTTAQVALATATSDATLAALALEEAIGN